jgi:hypothetical protein
MLDYNQRRNIIYKFDEYIDSIDNIETKIILNDFRTKMFLMSEHMYDLEIENGVLKLGEK